jgi:hypothetical protein
LKSRSPFPDSEQSNAYQRIGMMTEVQLIEPLWQNRQRFSDLFTIFKDPTKTCGGIDCDKHHCLEDYCVARCNQAFEESERL